MKKLLLLSMLCLATLTMQAQKRCVVLDFQVGTNVTEEESENISYCFRSNFQPTGYTKVEQVQVNRTISELSYSRTEMTQQQMMKVGRELEANIIVVGTLNKNMEEYSVDIRVIDVAKGITTVTESSTFQIASYRDAMEKNAKGLVSKLANNSSNNPNPNPNTKPTNTKPIRIVIDPYVDLGLPSGTKWKNVNATGFYTYNEAISQFGKRLPTKNQWEELKAECLWTWTGNGYKVTGPNGNFITLPAEGNRNCGGSIYGGNGYYWSSTPYGSEYAMHLAISSKGVETSYYGERCLGLSVRLVQ